MRTLLLMTMLAVPVLAQAAPRTVTAELAYRERIALPPGSKAVLEVVAAGTQVAARSEVTLDGRQVPVPMRVEVDPARLPQGAALALRGTLSDPSGAMRWTGTRPLSLARDGGVTAIGAWMLTRGEAAAEKTYRARGQEPFWSLTLGQGRMVLELDAGAQRVVMPLPAREMRDGVAHLAVRTEAHDVAVAITPGPCRDTMSGVPHPDNVRVRIDDRTLSGCGGDPAALLQGAEWVVESAGGLRMDTPEKVTITFDADGRVYGRSACNGFNGGYRIGEGLEFSPIAATMRLCEPPLMEREAALFGVLQGTVPFNVVDGRLTIGVGEKALIARRR